MQKRGVTTRRTSWKQEKTQKRKGDRATHSHEKQVRTRGTSNQKITARSHSQVFVLKVGGGYFRKRSASGGAG